MPEKKIIAVVGATGAQGGGLVRAIMRDKAGPFTARALTRNPASEKAQALAALGAEVVRADIDDPGSLASAFAGADAAYCVTFFWDHLSGERETREGRAMARAAKDAGVHHVIWSTFEDTRKFIPLTDTRMPTLQGKYKVAHFDAKADADAAFTELSVPTTFLLTSFYWDNMIHLGAGPAKGPDGTLAITFPLGDKKLPGIASEDIGKCAYGIFKQGKEFIGKTVGIATRCLPELRFPRRRRFGQHVPVQTGLQRRVLRRAQRGVLPVTQPGVAELRTVARAQQEPDTARGRAGLSPGAQCPQGWMKSSGATPRASAMRVM